MVGGGGEVGGGGDVGGGDDVGGGGEIGGGGDMGVDCFMGGRNDGEFGALFAINGLAGG